MKDASAIYLCENEIIQVKRSFLREQELTQILCQFLVQHQSLFREPLLPDAKPTPSHKEEGR